MPFIADSPAPVQHLEEEIVKDLDTFHTLGVA